MIAEAIAVTFTGANGIASVCKNSVSAKSSSISVDDAYATQGRKGARTQLGLLSGCIAVGFGMVDQPTTFATAVVKRHIGGSKFKIAHPH